MTQPWDKLPKETDRAWAAFVLHRSTDPASRSLRNTAAQLFEVDADKVTKVRLRQMQEWSVRYEWPARVDAFDRWTDLEIVRELHRDRVRMARRHAALARRAQTRAAERLLSLALDEISAQAAVRMMAEGIRLERQALGEPDLTVEGVQALGNVELDPDAKRDRVARDLAARADELRESARLIASALEAADGGELDDDEDAEAEADA